MLAAAIEVELTNREVYGVGTFKHVSSDAQALIETMIASVPTETERVIGVLSKQYTHIGLSSIIRDITSEAEQLKTRSSQHYGKIERNRYVVHNAWVVPALAYQPKQSGVFTKLAIRLTESLENTPSWKPLMLMQL